MFTQLSTKQSDVKYFIHDFHPDVVFHQNVPGHIITIDLKKFEMNILFCFLSEYCHCKCKINVNVSGHVNYLFETVPTQYAKLQM